MLTVIAQYEAWQRARSARAGPPVSLSSTSSGPSTRDSSQQGGTPMSLESASAQSIPMFDSPTKAAGAAPHTASPDAGVDSELQLGDTLKTSPMARSRAALRAAAAAAGSKFGL